MNIPHVPTLLSIFIMNSGLVFFKALYLMNSKKENILKSSSQDTMHFLQWKVNRFGAGHFFCDTKCWEITSNVNRRLKVEGCACRFYAKPMIVFEN